MKSNKEAPKRTRWTGEDCERLKLAIKLARNPRSTEDWEWIARQIGDRHSAAECKEEATTKLGWKPKHSKGDEAKRSFDTLFNQDDDSREFELDPSDSMLIALRSPTQKAKTRRRPFVPKVLNNTILEQGDDSGSSDSESDDK